MPLLQTIGNAASRAWQRLGPLGPVIGSDFQLISTQVLSANATSVTFSSIPQTFKHLQIRLTGRTDSAGSASDLCVTFNGTSGSYAYHQLYSTGSSVGSLGYSSSNSGNKISSVFAIAGGGATTGAFGTGVIDVLDYTQTTKNKTVKSFGGVTNNLVIGSGLWLNTSAVTSIVFSLQSASNIVSGSRFSLYGWN